MQPTGYSSRFSPLVAYTESGGVWTQDTDLEVTEAHLGSSGKLTTAAGKLYTGPVLSAIPGHPQVRAKLTRAQIASRYPTHRRIAIGRLNAQGLREFVAVGYLDKMTVKFGATASDPPQAFWRESWRMTTCLAREAAAQGRVLLGQHYVSEELAAALGDDWWDAELTGDIGPGEIAEPFSLVRAQRLCFNPAGKPNRFRRPITVTIPARHGQAAYELDLYAFCDPDSAHAEPWTYHQALQYLWYWSMVNAATGAGNLLDPSSDINYGLGFGATATNKLTPDQVADQPPGWLASMVRYCESFAPDGMTILEALKMLHQLCGVRYREEYANWSDTPVAEMRFWCPGENEPGLGAPAAEVLEVEEDGSPFTPTGQLRDVETDLLRRNNTTSARILTDDSCVLNHVEVIGERRQVVVRMELMPLWEPATGWWDELAGMAEYLVDLATDGDDFKLALESDFAARFHPDGEWYGIGDRSIVGRAWGMDFGAELDPADYNRASGPYDDYGVINWGALGNWGAVGPPTDLVRRRRRIMPLTAKDSAGRSVGVVLEVSWDSGDTWHRLGGNEFRTVPEHGAILVKPDNLLGFGATILKTIEAKTGSKPVRNYYHAYLLGVFRMRVTGLVDLDDRLIGGCDAPWAGSTGPLGSLSVSRSVLRTDEFGRVETGWFQNHGFVGLGEVDDTAKADACAAGTLDPHLAGKRSASPVIPWLDLSPARYPLGTPIEGIRRSLVNSAHDLSFVTALDPQTALRPEVVGVILRQSVEGASTELIIEDYTYAGAKR